MVLFALSFGSVVGLKMVHARPELFAAYVGSGQFVSAREGDALGYQLTLAAARAAGNTEAVQTLEALGPPPWQDVKARNEAKGWATRMTRADDPASKMRVREMLKGLADYSDADRENLWKGAGVLDRAAGPGCAVFRCASAGPALSGPALRLPGRRRPQHADAAREALVADLEAPVKDIVVVEHASHGAFYTHSEQVGRFLAERVRPLASRR